MKFLVSSFYMTVCALLLYGCQSSDEILWTDDAGQDAGVDGDAETDVHAGQDAGMDGDAETDVHAGQDAGMDGATDAGADTGRDAGVDAGTDAGQDAGQDAGADGAVDAGLDAGGDVVQDAGADESVDGGTGDSQTGDSGGDQQQHVSYCVQVCDSPSDCASQYPPWDADNYDCNDGACEYLGCHSDEECKAVPGMESYVCAADQITGLDVCTKSCSSVSDCATPSAPWDEDNYSCDNGACHYTGCNSDQECQSVQGLESYVCAAQVQGALAQCLPGCSTVEDCDMGSVAYDQDNYFCDDGLCVYTGCNSDEECRVSMNGVSWECR